MVDDFRLAQLEELARALLKELQALRASEQARAQTAALPYPDARARGARIP